MPKFVITHIGELMPEDALRRILIKHEIRSAPRLDDIRIEFDASFRRGVPAALEIIASPEALFTSPRVFVGELQRPLHDYTEVELRAQEVKARNILRILGSFLFWRPKRLQQAAEEARLLLQRLEEIIPPERRKPK